MEQWKELKGYDGRYAISNHGRIKSLWHEHSVGFENREIRKVYAEKMVAITDNGKGYKIVSLSKNGKRKNFYVHRLVAEYFLENKDGCDIVNHKDFNTGNNASDNLEWCTQKENIDYSLSNNRGKRKFRKTSSGEHHIQVTKYGTYKVVIDRKEKYFKSLEDAVNYRDMVLEIAGGVH